MSATRLLNTLLRVKHISRCETSTHRDDVFIPEHEPERKSRDTPTHGGSVISFLGSKIGIELLSRFSRSRDDFCSNDSLVTVWAHRTRLDVRAHALLRCRRDDSSANSNGAGHRCHRSRVRGGLDRQIYSVAGHWGWDTAFKISGLAILVVMTLKHTSRPGPISLHRVMGGVAAHLLIGLTWAFGYKLLMEARPEAIQFRTFVGEIPTAEPSRLIYFSFCTLTNLDQCRLWRRIPCTSYCAIFGNGTGRATVSLRSNRDICGDVITGAI